MLNYEREYLETVIPGIDKTLCADSLESLESNSDKVANIFRNSGAPKIFVPQQYGGAGRGAKEAIYLQIAIASRCPSLAIMMTMHNFTILTLRQMLDHLPYTAALFQAVASDNCLVSSGFAEGRSGADILDSNVFVDQVERGFLVNGSKKPCTMTNHFDFLTAGVSCLDKLSKNNEPQSKRPGLVIIPRECAGIERREFWRSPVLRGADSHEVQLRDVFIDNDKVFLPEPVDEQLQMQLLLIHSTGLSWFQLLVSSSYLGIAAALLERLLAKGAAPDSLAELTAAYESAITALEGLAEFIDAGERLETVLGKSLSVRFGVQKQVSFIVEKCVGLLGGMNYIKGGDTQYLLAASHCLAFHPLSWSASVGLLGEYIHAR